MTRKITICQDCTKKLRESGYKVSHGKKERHVKCEECKKPNFCMEVEVSK